MIIWLLDRSPDRETVRPIDELIDLCVGIIMPLLGNIHLLVVGVVVAYMAAARSHPSTTITTVQCIFADQVVAALGATMAPAKQLCSKLVTFANHRRELKPVFY